MLWYAGRLVWYLCEAIHKWRTITPFNVPKNGNTALSLAKTDEVSILLIDAGAKMDRLSIIEVAKKGHSVTLDRLIKAGFDLENHRRGSSSVRVRVRFSIGMGQRLGPGQGQD